ncbi:hypothetical protein DPEC_G00158230 [Dallia pectoralis]|uniref:Uncharacterized protein n=1 Tax=Dallia pectoralis TaxID=75939 RepID=A0ACC2GLA8_DALPE|nr:hypothetical protein DPEC_G00158230 [Dallia pectoralis]
MTCVRNLAFCFYELPHQDQQTRSLTDILTDPRDHQRVKKKWSDIKITTKRRVSALKRSQSQTGGGPPDPSLLLTPTEEQVAALIGTVSLEGITGGEIPTTFMMMALQAPAPSRHLPLSPSSSQSLFFRPTQSLSRCKWGKPRPVHQAPVHHGQGS